MRICSDCFHAPSWPANALGEPSSGKCSFCCKVRKSWEPKAWSEHLLGLLDLYDISAEGLPIGERVQKDWSLFRTDRTDLISDFIVEAVKGTEYKVSQLTTIEPKREAGLGLVGKWENLSNELRNTDRYFAVGAVDFRDSISGLLRQHTSLMKQGNRLYRARVHEQSEQFAPKDLDAPPKDLCTPGRANPAGIRYIYLAHSHDTAIHEVRPQRGAVVAFGEFAVQRDLELFSLVTNDAPDFFGDGASDALDVRALVLALAEQLQAPVLQASGPIDYVPTQYLCSLVRAEGLDGVEYPSSLDSSGTNVVLFEPDDVKVNDNIEYVRIDTVSVDWSVTTLPDLGGS